MAHTVMAHISMAVAATKRQGYIVMALCSYGLYSYGLYSYGPYSYGLYSYGTKEPLPPAVSAAFAMLAARRTTPRHDATRRDVAQHTTAGHGTARLDETRRSQKACSTSTCMLRTHTRTVALLGIDLICSSGQVPVMPAHGCTHNQHKRLRALASMHMPMQAPMRCCLSYTLTALSSSFGVRHTGSACVRAFAGGR